MKNNLTLWIVAGAAAFWLMRGAKVAAKTNGPVASEDIPLPVVPVSEVIDVTGLG